MHTYTNTVLLLLGQKLADFIRIFLYKYLVIPKSDATTLHSLVLSQMHQN